jgi:hypothetical protein
MLFVWGGTEKAVRAAAATAPHKHDRALRYVSVTVAGAGARHVAWLTHAALCVGITDTVKASWEDKAVIADRRDGMIHLEDQ